MSGTGSAAMEASIANFIEEGETILIAKKGYFGDFSFMSTQQDFVDTFGENPHILGNKPLLDSATTVKKVIQRFVATCK